MKQILQNLSNGETILEEIPCPRVKAGHLLIRTSNTLISAGTEKMLIDFGKANMIDKARQQPDKVKMVIDKIKTDGLMPTINSVKNKLDQPIPLGYCNVGTVIEVGRGVEGFAIGDRVASNGNHAEVVCVPKNLCAKIPDNVSDEEAAFTVISAIALQGIRLAQPTLGEAVVVTGLGLLGQLAIQMLRSHGCRVLGIDMDSEKCEMAKSFGAEVVDLSQGDDPIAIANAFSRGRGVDAVLITAATKSNEPMHQAATMCRKRGRIVLVGVVGLELSRADFFEKEISFQVSCSYGPGRYDPLYEEGGQDYPLGFVRWTEQRNFEAVLDMLSDDRMEVESLISHRFPIDDFQGAYNLVTGKDPSLGVLMEYSNADEKQDSLRKQTIAVNSSVPGEGKVVLGVIGSGNYATSTLIPAFASTGAILKSVASSGGISSTHAAKKFGFKETTTNTEALYSDNEINALIITTQHDTHARFICSALEAGKHVFVEKPICINREELNNIKEVYAKSSEKFGPRILMVGFNRRFSPFITKAKDLLSTSRIPKSFIMTVNAGDLPFDHWHHDKEVGGGRIVSEGCHFIDLLRFLTDSKITGIKSTMMGAADGVIIRDDKVSITISFADGSFGTVHYLANGSKSFPKERLEIFSEGRILQLDNFRKLTGFGWGGFNKIKKFQQDKGQSICSQAFVDAIKNGGEPPISFDEIVEVAEACFDVMDDLAKN